MIPKFDEWGVDERQFWLRGIEPGKTVEYDPETRMWHVYGHPEIVQLLSKPKVFSSNLKSVMGAEVGAESEESYDELLYLDPPEHTRLRKLVTHAFTAKVVADLEAKIAALTHELLDAAGDTGRLELVGSLAYPLPVIVICELLGIPPEDRDLFREQAEALVPLTGDDVSLVGRFDGVEDVAKAVVQRHREFARYLKEFLDDRRKNPREDLLSGLVHAEVEGERLTDKEVAGLVDTLLLAGHLNTTMMLSNAVLCLDSHPEEFRRVRADRSLLPGVVEESLRYLPPFSVTSRVTAVETELGGEVIPADQLVMVWMATANRDPRVFDVPNEFRPRRHPNPHLTFSRGVHFCFGAGLARLEGRVVLDVLLDRFPELATIPGEPPRFVRTAQMFNAHTLPLTASR